MTVIKINAITVPEAARHGARRPSDAGLRRSGSIVPRRSISGWCGARFLMWPSGSRSTRNRARLDWTTPASSVRTSGGWAASGLTRLLPSGRQQSARRSIASGPKPNDARADGERSAVRCGATAAGRLSFCGGVLCAGSERGTGRLGATGRPRSADERVIYSAHRPHSPLPDLIGDTPASFHEPLPAC